MDYDAYARLMAVNTILMNGDYIDEMMFYDRSCVLDGGGALVSANARRGVGGGGGGGGGGEGAVVDSGGQACTPYYSVHPWDLDSIGTPCHHHAKRAIKSPLLYCAEVSGGGGGGGGGGGDDGGGGGGGGGGLGSVDGDGSDGGGGGDDGRGGPLHS